MVSNCAWARPILTRAGSESSRSTKRANLLADETVWSHEAETPETQRPGQGARYAGARAGFGPCQHAMRIPREVLSAQAPRRAGEHPP